MLFKVEFSFKHNGVLCLAKTSGNVRLVSHALGTYLTRQCLYSIPLKTTGRNSESFMCAPQNACGARCPVFQKSFVQSP